ncbi:MAG: hypothetical protein LBG87_05315 [Spirochaetaceae bacterium]|jgi:uncharacterized membrane protein YcgQ (UPF0703/DUF1980 family)|nr:hypothetical protein [Spirochaetaceae bacterium]
MKYGIITLAVLLAFSGCAEKKAGAKIGSAAVGLSVDPPAEYSGTVSGAKTESKKTPLMVTAKKANEGNIIEIREKMFIAQTNEIYLNPEEYLGKTLKLEGIFQTQKDYTLNGNPYYFVIRNGPGCCPGIDSSAGFEVLWENPAEPYPNPNDWVEAVGVLSQYEEDGYPYLCLSLTSLEVLDVRGAEFVTQ